jgi:four helix bundle protein
MSGTFEDLKAWRLAMDLVVAVYAQTQVWPKDERYGLTTQLRRAAVSIPSNIAEGKGRASDRDFAKFLNYARGSVYEVQTQLKIARRLDYLSANTANAMDHQAAEVGRVLNGLIRVIQGMTRREGEPEDALCPETRKPEA